jgi:hypothetical protein
MSKLIRGIVTLGLAAMLAVSSGCATGKSGKINYVTEIDNGYRTFGCASGNLSKEILIDNATVAARANLVQELYSDGKSPSFAQGLASNCSFVGDNSDSSKQKVCVTLECYNP